MHKRIVSCVSLKHLIVSFADSDSDGRDWQVATGDCWLQHMKIDKMHAEAIERRELEWWSKREIKYHYEKWDWGGVVQSFLHFPFFSTVPTPNEWRLQFVFRQQTNERTIEREKSQSTDEVRRISMFYDRTMVTGAVSMVRINES